MPSQTQSQSLLSRTRNQNNKDFLLRWRVTGGGVCSEPCAGSESCFTCSRTATTTAAAAMPDSSPGATADCGVLENGGGPLAECHARVGAWPFISHCRCVADKEEACRVISAYASLCQSLGVPLKYWRRSARCAMMTCPLNSHYETCGTACPATCATPHAPLSCPLPCAESCQCNVGYLLSAGTCVPATECGCVHRGAYHLPAEPFWVGVSCSMRCVCAAGGRADCTISVCPEGTRCAVQDGRRACHPLHPTPHRVTCTLMGGRRLTTYEGRSLDVHLGGCRYVLSQGCGGGQQGEESDNDAVAVHIQRGAVFLQLQDLNVTLEEQCRVTINNSTLKFPVRLERVSVYGSCLVTRVVLASGVLITYGGPELLRVTLPSPQRRTQCGLCAHRLPGAANLTQGTTHATSNDKDLYQAGVEDNLEDVSSWSVSGSNCSSRVRRNCPDGGSGCSNRGCNATRVARFRSAELCGALSRPTGPFADCHGVVDPRPFLEDCVKHLCRQDATAPKEAELICGALRAYAFVCQEEAAELRPWRGDACSISCPANSHYSVCASSCPESCASVGTAGTVCPWPCVEGCQCDPGFVQSSGGCVKPHDCGCMCKGRYYEEGETMDGCSVPCNNTDAATWLCCEAAPCPEGMNCTSMSSVKGERTQSLRPPSPATNQEARPLCTLGGNASHVSAFDGREHRLRGRCRYRLLGACGGGGPRPGGPPFPVEVDAQADAQSVLSVWVKLNGSLLEMTSNNTYTVQVNGVNSILPYVLSPSVTVNSTSASTYVHDAELGFMLTLAKDGRLSIHLSGELVNTTCGLCSDPTAQEAWWSNGDPWCTNDVSCPANSHYESCGSTCPPSCVPSGNGTSCDVSPQCVPGCVCDRGLVSSPEGCVRPEHCGCTDPSGRYHPNGAPFYIPEDCGQLCHCPLGGGGQALCVSQICPRGQVCKRLAAGGERRCRPGQPLNCTYVNGLHLGTFDGRRLAFRDACAAAAYALVASGTDGAGSSSSAAELTAFNVTISDASCAKRFSHSLELTLWLGGTRVLVGKHHPDKILVDGLLVQLPFHHPSGLVEAQRGPSSLLIRTHFGLRLSVYTTGTVLVELPDMYRSSVSGLCGNANGDPLDDYLTLGGELVANVSQFARSWRSGGAEEEACASTDCVSAQRNCSEEQLEFFRGEDFCGVLLNPLGPFEECVSVLGPRHYVEVCAQDCCRYDGHHAALCSSIAAYAAACQAAQLMVRHWRSETFCAMSCPMNSHYELRGSDCRPACGGVNDDQSAACSGRSQEGCQCDEGFLLSDGHCVAPWDCGCLYHGQYYPAGVFYPGHSCHECRCLGGVVDCSAAPCGDQESCTVVDGVARCRPLELGVCQVFGGFAYLTFDGRALAFRGAPCTYVLSQRSSTGQSVEDSGHTGQSEEDSGYTVLVSFQTDGNGTRRAISRLELRLHSLNLTLDPQTPWKIQVNMEDRTLPLDVGPIRAFSSGHSVFISSVHQSGVSLQLSANQYVRLSVPSARDGEPSGLCGDFSGEPSDDLRLRSGRLTDDPAEFQRSWVVAGGPRDSAQQCNASYSGAASTAPPEAVAGCDALVARSEPFQGCWDEGRGAEEADLYREACLEALHSGASVSEAVCLALEGYATACREAGFTVGAWRHNTTCSLQCPVEGSSARRCVDPAVSSCPALLQPGSAAPSGRGQAATMGRVCYEGCQCDGDDSLMDGDACVAMRECGCFHQGRYIKADEELLTERCAQRCRCHPLGGAVCQAAPCRPWEQCALLDSAWACRPGPQPPACRLRGGLHITTPTGHTVALGDSQVYPYNVVSLCDRTSQNWFRVVSFHGRCDNGTTPRTVDVLQVLFHGRVSVTIQEGAVKVKGHRVPLPHTLPSVGVSLSVGDTLDTVVLRRGVASPGTEAWLEVEAGLSGEATVRLAAAGRMGPLCGLCGDVGHTPFPSRQPITSWLLPDVPACGFNQ